MNKFSFFILLFISVLSACSSFLISDRREGLIYGSSVFRVYVHFEDFEYRDSAAVKRINEKILSDSALRMSDLMNAFAKKNLKPEDRDALELFSLKKDILCKIRYRKIGEEDVEAFVDYTLPANIAELLSQTVKNTPDVDNNDE